MTIAALSKRLAALESRRGSGCVAAVVNLAGHPPEIVAEAARNPRSWIADGRAHRTGSTLILMAPVLTRAEWIARHVPPHARPTCA